MANEHIKTAAANLQRAAQDGREQQNAFRHQIDDSKRECATRIAAIKAQMGQMQRIQADPNVNESLKVANSIQMQNLNNEIAQTQKDNDRFVSEVNNQISGLDGQIREFENIASRLNGMA